MNRRQVLLTTGSASLLLVGGYAGYAMTRDAPSVREPWKRATKGFGDPRLDALAYAILAPSPHNRQPWIVELDGDAGFTLFPDLDRLLPETDPPNRQIVIGFGAFLEMFRMAAAEVGYRTEVTPFPDGEPQPVLDARPIARVAMLKDSNTARERLFDMALERRTNRAPFSGRIPPEDVLRRLGAASGAGKRFGFTSEPEAVARLQSIATAAWGVEVNLARTHAESVRLTRIGAEEVRADPDGISLYGPMMELYSRVGLLSREGMEEIGSSGHTATEAFYAKSIAATPAFAWLTSPGNRRIDQLQAGRDWVRLQLAAAAGGLAFHPLSQALQEFPEMADPFRDIHAALGIADLARVQGLFRLGYADAPRPSPRWPLESRLRRA